MREAMAMNTDGAAEVHRLLVHGDLAKLSADQRLVYYRQVCESLGLNPLTQPLEYVTLSGRLRLYARKDCAEQLRKLHRVSVEIVSREVVDECLVVHAKASMPDGRHDEDYGAVHLGQLKGEARANAILKAVTKAKRRVTLSICGLGFLDETEVEDVPSAEVEPPPPRPATGQPEKAKAQPAPAGQKRLPPDPDADRAAVEQAAYEVKVWTDWLNSRPGLDGFNETLRSDLPMYSPPGRKQAWALAKGYATEMGWQFDAEAKRFFAPKADGSNCGGVV
jgi:hypothetical protein